MLIDSILKNRKKTSHLAGLIYFLLAVTGIFSLMYVPKTLIDLDNVSITIVNIRESDLLFRLGIVGRLFSEVLFIFLSLVLYNLLKSVYKPFAILMVILVLTSVAMDYLNVVNLINILSIIENTAYSNSLTVSQLETNVMSLLDSYFNGLSITEIFWGLWLFPFGYLVFKSRFLPKFLGICLMLGCFGYLISFLGSFFWYNYHDTIIPKIIAWPARIGELGSCLWLLIFGSSKKVK